MNNNELTFAQLGLTDQMLGEVAAKGFEAPTPVQRLTIPRLLNSSNDIIAQSQTGTGKTAAYGLPLLQSLDPQHKVQAIVLVPTRELAVQVTEELISFNHTRHLSIGAIYGGASMSEQLRRLQRGIDIVVGTPGRTLDHIRRKTLDLSEVRFLILDEADEMLDMGFIEDVEEIMSNIDTNRRAMMFSATMPDRIVELSKRYMRDVEVVRVESAQLTTELTDQIYFEVREGDKFDALTRIIDIQPEFYGIVFCRTKVAVDEVSSRLIERGYDAEALHGDISQAQREKILKNFKNKRINILVATDVAARGIDVSNLTHVINYSLPQDSESYVHRIGRTGRAGNQGTAVTFITKSEMRQFGWLKRDIKVDIKREELPSPQDIVAMKRQKIQDDLAEIINDDSFGDYNDMAAGLLEQYDPATALSALLRLAFRDDLDERNYPEIRSFSVDRRGTARLFIGVGRNDGYDARRLVTLLKNECGLRDKNIDDVHLSDTFSFVSVPYAEAEEVIVSLNRRQKGERPLAKFANPDSRGQRDEEQPQERKSSRRSESHADRSSKKSEYKDNRGSEGRGESRRSEGGYKDGGRRSSSSERPERPERGRSDRPSRGRSESAGESRSSVSRVPRKSEMSGGERGGRKAASTKPYAKSKPEPRVERADEEVIASRFGKVKGYRDYNDEKNSSARSSSPHQKISYKPDHQANESFDWGAFERSGNSWDSSERGKKTTKKRK